MSDQDPNLLSDPTSNRGAGLAPLEGASAGGLAPDGSIPGEPGPGESDALIPSAATPQEAQTAAQTETTGTGKKTAGAEATTLNDPTKTSQAKVAAVASPPSAISILMQRFTTAMKSRDFHAAIKAINDVMMAGGADQTRLDHLARSLLMGYMPVSAMMVLDWALQKFPQSPRLLFRRGITQTELGRLDEAIASFDAAIRLNPKPPEFHMGLADALLLAGQWKRGLVEYEWRYEIMHGRKILEPFSENRWHGEPVNGKRVLVYGEQGYGDTFQFCRYLPMVKSLGAEVVFGVSPELHGVMSGVAGVDTLTSIIPSHDSYDYHSPVSSLPRVLGTTMDDIPANVPYISVDPKRAERWKARLADIPRPRIALTWAGRPTHPRNHNRSIPLEKFEPLAPMGPFLSVSPLRVSQSDLRARGSQLKIREFGHRLKDFADTAALLQEIDLLITVDTSVAHLAGALARPVWILIPHNPDWRWQLGRTDTPWYPTLRLYRQQIPGEWEPTINQLRRDLHQWKQRWRRLPKSGG